MKPYLPFGAAMLAGAGVWLGIIAVFGGREAWDCTLYWSVGYPLMAIAAFSIACLAPERPWRWGLTVIGTQAICGFLRAFPGGLNLWPLSLALIVALALPLIAASYLGAFARRLLQRCWLATG